MHRSPSISAKDLLVMANAKIQDQLPLSPPLLAVDDNNWAYRCSYSGLDCASAFAFPEAILKGRVPKEPSSRLRGRFLDANCAVSWLKEHKDQFPEDHYQLAVKYVADRVAATHGESTRASFALAPPAGWLASNGGTMTTEQWLSSYKSPQRMVPEIVANEEVVLRRVQKEERNEKKRAAAAANGDEPKKSAPKKKKDAVEGDVSDAAPKKKNKKPSMEVDSVVAAAVVPPPAAPKKRAKKASSADDPVVAAAQKSVVSQQSTALASKVPAGKKHVRVGAGKTTLEGETPNFYALATKMFVGSADAFRTPEYAGLLVVDKGKMTLRPLCGSVKVTVDDVQMAKVAPMELSGLAPSQQ